MTMVTTVGNLRYCLFRRFWSMSRAQIRTSLCSTKTRASAVWSVSYMCGQFGTRPVDMYKASAIWSHRFFGCFYLQQRQVQF
jgi:hypothetical protein